MPTESVVAAADICQSVVPVISLMAYLPQWRKLVRTKSSAAISLRSWAVWCVSSSFAVFYAVVQLMLNGRGWALVASSSLGFTFVVATLALSVHYRPRPVAVPTRDRAA